MTNETYRVGDQVEVNIAGLRPITITDVLVDLEEHDDWHPAEIVAVLPDGRYEVLVMPLIGAIEIPPVDGARLRRR
jgi:hypothetical protein